MADRVDYTKLYSEAWQNVYDLINNRSNVVDPLSSTSAEFRKFVYTREPDVKSSDFAGYPYVIVRNAAKDEEEQKGKTLDGKSKFLMWEVEVVVVTSDRGEGERDGQGATQLDTISNDVDQTLNDATNRQTLRDNGLYHVKVTGSRGFPEPRENELTFRRTFVILFMGKMQVTS